MRETSPAPAPPQEKSIAIAHWGEHCNGGAERVAWEAQRGIDAPLYVGHRDPDIEPDDVDVRGLFTSRLANRAIKMGGFPRAVAYFGSWALSPAPLERLRHYDTLVCSGNETMFYCGPDTQTRVQYVHHTDRRHTDLLHWWPRTPKGYAGRAYAYVIRQLMNNTSNRPDLFVANSEVVARRVHKYWGVPKEAIRVVYPPVPTSTFSDSLAPTEDYVVSLGRLDNWHKHLSTVIRQLNNTDVTLKIAGTGPDEKMLQSLAADNVEFLGYVSEAEKRTLLAGARAFVFAGEQEDFGISTAEALASGTPVVGPEEGFTKFQIRPGKAGLTWDRNNPSSLRHAVTELLHGGVEWSSAEIEAHAENFSVERFHEGLRNAIDLANERSRVDVTWDSEPLRPCPAENSPVVADGGEQ